MSCVGFNLRMDGNPSSFGPANRRPPEETNAHNLFLQKIKTSGDGCGYRLGERATKLKSGSFKKVRNFLLLIRFPGGNFFFADTNVVGRHLVEG